MANRKASGCFKPLLMGIIALSVMSMVTFFFLLNRGLHTPAIPEYGALYLENVYLKSSTDSIPVLSAVLIEGTDMTCIGLECDVPEGATKMDGQGQYVLPGFVDLGISFAAVTEESNSQSFWSSLFENLRQRPLVRQHMQAAGITAVRTSGDPDDNILALTRQLLAGELEGPRMFPGGRLFTAAGGHPVATLLAPYEQAQEAFVVQVSDLNAGKQTVKEMLEKGLSGITLVLDDVVEHVPKLSAEVVEGLIVQAHQENAWACVRIGTTADMIVAANAGADFVAFMPRDEIDSVTIATLRAAGTTILPMLGASDSLETAELGDVRLHASEKVWQLHKAGIPIGVASLPGIGQSFGAAYQLEIQLLQQAGIPQAVLIDAMTSHAAASLAADDYLGKIEAGYSADLVLLQENPWEDGADLGKPTKVFQSGRVVFPLPQE